MWRRFVGYLTIVYQLLILLSFELDGGMIVYDEMESVRGQLQGFDREFALDGWPEAGEIWVSAVGAL
jgi:hypothetical protein